jgi:hypothetical protein
MHKDCTLSDGESASLLERLNPLVAASGQVIVLERVARGGGATRWFYCRTMGDVEEVLPWLRQGSRVTFLLDDRIIRRVPLCDDVEADIWELATTKGEVFVGTQRPSSLEIDMALLDSSELEEHLASVRSGDIVFYGAFPTTDDDGVSVVSFIPPDDDGVVRPRPV